MTLILHVTFYVYTCGDEPIETEQSFEGPNANACYTMFFEWITSISWKKYCIIDYDFEEVL